MIVTSWARDKGIFSHGEGHIPDTAIMHISREEEPWLGPRPSTLTNDSIRRRMRPPVVALHKLAINIIQRETLTMPEFIFLREFYHQS